MQDCCSYCERPYSNTLKKTIDHIVPLSKGGIGMSGKVRLAHLSNLIDACEECNCLKDDMTLFQFLQKLTINDNPRREQRGNSYIVFIRNIKLWDKYKKLKLIPILVKNVINLLNEKPITKPHIIGNIQCEL